MGLAILLDRWPKKKRLIFWLTQGFNGGFLLGVGSLRDGWPNFIIELYGATYLIGVFIFIILGKDHRLVIDEIGIHAQVNWRRRIEFGWNEIAKAELRGLHLKLQTNGGRGEDISLLDVSYDEYQEFKHRFRTIIEDHGIQKPMDSGI